MVDVAIRVIGGVEDEQQAGAGVVVGVGHKAWASPSGWSPGQA